MTVFSSDGTVAGKSHSVILFLVWIFLTVTIIPCTGLNNSNSLDNNINAKNKDKISVLLAALVLLWF